MTNIFDLWNEAEKGPLEAIGLSNDLPAQTELITGFMAAASGLSIEAIQKDYELSVVSTRPIFRVEIRPRHRDVTAISDLFPGDLAQEIDRALRLSRKILQFAEPFESYGRTPEIEVVKSPSTIEIEIVDDLKNDLVTIKAPVEKIAFANGVVKTLRSAQSKVKSNRPRVGIKTETEATTLEHRVPVPVPVQSEIHAPDGKHTVTGVIVSLDNNNWRGILRQDYDGTPVKLQFPMMTIENGRALWGSQTRATFQTNGRLTPRDLRNGLWVIPEQSDFVILDP